MGQSTNDIMDKMQLFVGDISGKHILDIGCGKGKWACLLRAEMQSDNSNPAYIVGMETFEPYIEYAKSHGSINRVIQFDLEKLLELPFHDKSFDIIICTECIEHLNRSTGLMLLDDFKRVAKEKIFISVPGFWMQHFAADGNLNQIHKSRWELDDFESRGYTVEGIGVNINITNRFGIKQKMQSLFPWIGHFFKNHASTWVIRKLEE